MSSVHSPRVCLGQRCTQLFNQDPLELVSMSQCGLHVQGLHFRLDPQWQSRQKDSKELGNRRLVVRSRDEVGGVCCGTEQLGLTWVRGAKGTWLTVGRGSNAVPFQFTSQR